MGSIETNKFNIIVIGAGIAGLTTAIGLHQKGHHVSVLERHPDTQALGGPINMSPSATRILTSYGLKDLIHEQLRPIEKPVYFRRYERGQTLGHIPIGATEEMYGTP